MKNGTKNKENLPNSKPPSSNNQHSSGKMAHGLQVEPRGLPKPGDVGGDTKTNLENHRKIMENHSFLVIFTGEMMINIVPLDIDTDFRIEENTYAI